MSTIEAADTATEIEVLLNGDNQVAVLIDPLPSKPMAYRIVDRTKMTISIRDEGGKAHLFGFPEHAGEAWQALVDNELLLVTEVLVDDPEGDNASATAVFEGSVSGKIVRDDYISPEA